MAAETGDATKMVTAAAALWRGVVWILLLLAVSYKGYGKGRAEVVETGGGFALPVLPVGGVRLRQLSHASQ